MGYERNRAIVVSSFLDELIEDAHDEALRIFDVPANWSFDPHLTVLVSPIMPSAVNGVRSFMIAPDGSKLGWETSKRAEAARREFVEYLQSLRYSDGSTSVSWAEVQFGDDDGEAKVITASDFIPDRSRSGE